VSNRNGNGKSGKRQAGTAKIYDFSEYKIKFDAKLKRNSKREVLKKAIARARSANRIFLNDLEGLRLDSEQQKVTKRDISKREEDCIFFYAAVHEDIKCTLVESGFSKGFAERFKRKYINSLKSQKAKAG
jgi:hypothetical protein